MPIEEVTKIEDAKKTNAIDYFEIDDYEGTERETLTQRAANTRALIDNVDYDILPAMRNFDKARLDLVEYMAKGMAQQEILDYFGIVDVLTRVEKGFFNFAFKRGVSKGKREAVDKFFIAMGDRNGAVHAYKYLQVHADRFPEDAAGAINPHDSGKFNFQVNLKD